MAITIPQSLATGTPEQKARAYAQLRNEGNSDADIVAAIDKTFGAQNAGDIAYLQRLAQPFINTSAAKTNIRFPLELQMGTPEQKAQAYAQLVNQGISEPDIVSAINQTFGQQSQEDIRALQNLASPLVTRNANTLPYVEGAIPENIFRGSPQEKADYFNTLIKSGKTPDQIRQMIESQFGPQKQEDLNFLYQLAAPGTPVLGAGNIVDKLKTVGDSKIDPIIAPYLDEALGRARSLFLTGQQPTLYPGQMYVSPSEQTLTALSSQEALARAAQPTLEAAQQAYMQGLGGLSATALGGFLTGSPYQQQMITAAARPLVQQFSESVVPGISSQFSRAGRYGSGAMERALGTASESFGRALGDVTANIVGQDYARERGFQQQAIGALGTAAQQAPQMFAQQFLPSQALAQVGAQREAIAGQPLQEAIQRYNFAQQLPYSQLSGYLSSVYGSPLGNLQQMPNTQNSTLQNLGGLLTGGAAIYSALPSNTKTQFGNWLGGLFG